MFYRRLRQLFISAVQREARGKMCARQTKLTAAPHQLPLNNHASSRCWKNILPAVFLLGRLLGGCLLSLLYKNFSHCTAFHNGTRKMSYALQRGEAQLLEARKLEARGKMWGFLQSYCARKRAQERERCATTRRGAAIRSKITRGKRQENAFYSLARTFQNAHLASCL